MIQVKEMTVCKRIFTLLTLFLTLTACTSLISGEAEMGSYKELRFTSERPIELKVRQINVISEFTPSFTRPNVEHLFPVSIEKTAKLWAKDRLEAVDFSSDREAEFIINDASVTEELEKSEQMFTKDRIIYRANLDVTLRITDTKSFSKAETQVIAWRELIIPADTDIAEKEKYWNGMVEKLFSEFNLKMDSNVQRYLNLYILNNNSVQNFD